MQQGEWIGVGTFFALAAFVGVCVWAWSDRRKPQFDEAAQLPFADDHIDARSKERRDE